MPTHKVVVPDKEWHFSRTFSVDSLIQIAGIALVLGLPLLYWGRSLESRVLTLENFNLASVQADNRREADTRETRLAFSTKMEGLERKLVELQISIEKVLAVQAIPRNSPSQRR